MFASADMGIRRNSQPNGSASPSRPSSATPFACRVGSVSSLTPATALDRMLDPNLVLATSTPKADPGGDYAWAVFARANQVHPGAQAILEAKARPLVGGPDLPTLRYPGMALSPPVPHSSGGPVPCYCSNVAPLLADVPGLVSVPLEPPLAPQGADRPQYGIVALTIPTSPAASLPSSSRQPGKRSWPATASILSNRPNQLLGGRHEPARLSSDRLRWLPCALVRRERHRDNDILHTRAVASVVPAPTTSQRCRNYRPSPRPSPTKRAARPSSPIPSPAPLFGRFCNRPTASLRLQLRMARCVTSSWPRAVTAIRR